MPDGEAVDVTGAMIALTGSEQDEQRIGGLDLVVTDNRKLGAYEATVGGRVAAGLVYSRVGEHMTLLATSVLPEFRGKGVAAGLMSVVLDDLRRQGMGVTATCPFARSFLGSHQDDRDHQGANPE